MLARSEDDVKKIFYSATEKPQFLKPDPNGIPDELKALPIWILWGAVYEKDRWLKLPYQLTLLTPKWERKLGRRFKLAKTNDPSHGWPFELVWDWYQECHMDADGIGLFLRHGLAGVDLDNCLKQGRVNIWAKMLVGDLDTWADQSPSGTGLKCLMYASMEKLREMPEVAAIGSQKLPKRALYGGFNGEVEVYDCSSPRFFAVTGRPPEGFDRPIAHNQDAFDQMYVDVFEDKLTLMVNHEIEKRNAVSAYATANPQHLVVEDQVVIAMASSDDFDRLFHKGDLSEFDGDHSRADLALCSRLAFWTGPNAERVERLFRLSALYRDKWERQDYRDWTLARAINHEKYYDWTRHDYGVQMGTVLGMSFNDEEDNIE